MNRGVDRFRNEWVEAFLPIAAIVAGVGLIVFLAAGCSTPEQRLRSLASVRVFVQQGMNHVGGPGKLRDYDQDSIEAGLSWEPFAGLEPPQRMILENPGTSAAADLVDDALEEVRAFEEAQLAGATTPASPHRWSSRVCVLCSAHEN